MSKYYRPLDKVVLRTYSRSEAYRRAVALAGRSTSRWFYDVESYRTKSGRRRYAVVRFN